MAEVRRRRYDAPAEMVHPDPIDHHAGGERMLGLHQPTRQGESAPARIGTGRWRLGFVRFQSGAQNGGHSRLDPLARHPHVPPAQQVNGRRLTTHVEQSPDRRSWT